MKFAADSPWQVQLSSLADTQRLGNALAESIQVPMALALCGPLGAGKTELVRSIARALGVPSEAVTSPTYVLMQRYQGVIKLIHLDLYRLKSSEEVWDLGVDEWMAEPALTILEWADKFPDVWPDQWLRCDLVIETEARRTARWSAGGNLAQATLEKLAAAWARSLPNAIDP